MKKLFILIILIATSFAYNDKLSQKIINTLDKVYNKKILFKENKTKQIDLTLLLFEAMRNWDDITPEAKNTLAKYKLNRPSLPYNYDSPSGKFKVYYTNTGNDAVSPTDANGNNVPDYVEYVAKILDTVYTVYQSMGYVMPYPVYPNKSTPTKFMVYLSGTEAGDGVYGYVQPDIKIGDNPNSTNQVEKNAWSSYMVLRNEYVSFVGGNATEADIALKVTCAHEFMHAVQFAVAETMDIYFMEMAAAWAEQLVYPNMYDNIQYTMMFSNPDIPLDYDDDETDIETYSGHWYSTWYFLKYITTQYGNNLVPAIYNNHINKDTYTSFNIELARYSTNYKDAYFNTAITLGIMNNNSAISNNYYFSKASDYLNELKKYGIYNVKYEKSHSYNGINDINFNFASSNKILMRFGTDYHRITSTSNFSLILTSNLLDSLKVALIQADKKTLPTKMKITIANKTDNKYVINVDNASEYSENILVVSNISKIADTISIPYSFTITKPVSNENIYKTVYDYKLEQNYPNPFNPTTNIIYSLPENSVVTIKVYNILGKEVAELYNGSQKAGKHIIKYDASNLPTGIYLVKLDSKFGTRFIKMNLIK
ncbi:MAG TPA: T9SS type A sorting domain-containing protein [Ignavibacteriales bacterium]|nr:T9SS type A sorting domain-containing protein [Ignavibacteriales bacterium]HOL81384.1 T9SS type A sorting domain-containing protein [Ignavibacteriales bacterium]HOM65499.1 T9SS type A sorting domain-containing protein [Ignavibacteriales bacterium]HPD67744.1 T9SS type A sorting domain-containing protein [Ignavibacteriales bacterium]HPP33847.1 T9SS type A sorting domain-containing protein [Ignavibacteriales bacterium]